MRFSIAIIAALALGCGSAQHPTGPSQEALVDGTFPPPHPAQQRPGKDGKCKLPEGWPELPLLVRRGACWAPLDATEAQCREAAKENPYHVWAEGRCWYILPGGQKKPQPTSNVSKPISPVTAR